MSVVTRLVGVASSWLKFDLYQKAVASDSSSQASSSAERTRSVPFESLPLRAGDPPFAAWGLWGDEDELGSLNLLTPSVVQNAAEEVTYGIRIPLK
jgi:hypothetical protein